MSSRIEIYHDVVLDKNWHGSKKAFEIEYYFENL